MVKTTTSLHIISAGILAYIWIETSIICLILILMAWDTLTWVIKSIKLHDFNSRRLIWWLVSKMLVVCAVLLTWATLQTFSWEATPLVTVSISAIMWMIWFGELMSSIQNIIVVRTWEKIKEVDVVWQTLNYIYKTIRKWLGSFLLEDEDKFTEEE